MNILNYEIEDFIGVFDTDFETQPLIDYFHWCYQTEGVYRRSGVSIPNQRKDTMAPIAFFSDKPELEPSVHVEMGANSKYISMYNEVITQCMHIYGDEYETVTGYDLQCSYINVQRTLPKQGYHSWHSEDPSSMTTRRVLVNMMYLNDVDDAGETEFLYQSKRIQPKKGRIVIWPAGFTHTHRGNPPLSGEKYIATAWYSNMNY
tara:strand:+ start:2822 stop:3433 length:612 start_codon:yes stop_codon:yes gene_type:complete